MKRDWQKLVHNDQLVAEIKKGTAFIGFGEKTFKSFMSLSCWNLIDRNMLELKVAKIIVYPCLKKHIILKPDQFLDL